MDEEKRAARRKLLAEIKGPWDAVKLEALSAPPQAPTPEVQAACEAAVAARVEDDVEPPPVVPTMDELDASWGDEDEPDEEDEPEPELPDERLDPVAYAEAKRAREERIEARRERRRAKVEAKKARRKARAEAARGKQKAKTKKPRGASPAPAAKGEPARESDPPSVAEAPSTRTLTHARSALAASTKPRGVSTTTWLVALIVLVLLAAAITAAVVLH